MVGVLSLASLLCCLGSVLAAGDVYYIGTGRADITGPAAEIEFVSHNNTHILTHTHTHTHSHTQMGYAMPTQIGNGIHFRQYSRAFILADSLNRTKFVFVNADICMGSQILKMLVS